ncbi:TldD/PmbA family protein [Candidatus Darwinibacter acetoxidans]|jgi:TldD protein|nr:TldD/PmbA family protein [Limnochordia bacterium]HPP71769.1 TldD/PmbA family protein [Limnochordia bacterium]HPU64414.1 TldD/PmbA family protein [Limnochordia bacterium]
MLSFPRDLYVDVRVEEAVDTEIRFKQRTLQSQKVRQTKGALIRVFDGQRWYYSSTTDVDNLQAQIDSLAQMAAPNPRILDHPLVQAFEVHRETLLRYNRNAVTDVPLQDKQALLEGILEEVTDPAVVNHTSAYVDNRTVKSFYSSLGAAVTFDRQICGIRLSLDIAFGDKRDQTVISKAADTFDELRGLREFFLEEMAKDIAYVRDAEPVVPGEYQVLLSPEATGVFTHESFGHKSEADFMLGDETVKAEWALGKRVGRDLLTIIDDSTELGSGYTPFDDEGTRGRKTEIISGGILRGRLHSTLTALALGEEPTGNARAVNFEFEPIVRMTTTYIAKGDRPLQEIIAEMERGIFVDTVKHGSGMSTFTIAPSRAYLIEQGKITRPVKISVITGNVFTTLQEVDAVSQEFRLASFVGGGCGKMEQWPLPVGFGGPYTRVRKLQVQ